MFAQETNTRYWNAYKESGTRPNMKSCDIMQAGSKRFSPCYASTALNCANGSELCLSRRLSSGNASSGCVVVVLQCILSAASQPKPSVNARTYTRTCDHEAIHLRLGSPIRRHPSRLKQLFSRPTNCCKFNKTNGIENRISFCCATVFLKQVETWLAEAHNPESQPRQVWCRAESVTKSSVSKF